MEEDKKIKIVVTSTIYLYDGGWSDEKLVGIKPKRTLNRGTVLTLKQEQNNYVGYDEEGNSVILGNFI